MDSTNSTILKVTTFLTLPTTLQLQIIKFTSWPDQKNLRLVCGHTLALVNHLGAVSASRIYPVTEHPGTLERLKACPFSPVKVILLGYGGGAVPLPINSSTRIGIPKTNYLFIGPQYISPENMLKLIRYYMKWCEKLTFYDTRLPYMKNIADFGCADTCLANVKSFEISSCFYTPEDLRHEYDFQQRWKSLGQFLLWASIPSLQELHLKIIHSGYPPPPPHSTPTFPINFNVNFVKFLIKHGPNLKYLNLSLISSFWTLVLPTFETMVNVEKLVLLFSDGLDSVDHDLVWNGFSHFKKLKTLWIDSRNENSLKLIGLLLSNNGNTLQSLDLFHRLTSLSWFYKIQVSFRDLTYLYVKVQCDKNCTIFNESCCKLDSLSKLSICIDCTFGGEGEEDFDWRESFIAWLIGFSPNLQTLDLTSSSALVDQPRISDVVALIDGLARLRSITFQTYGQDKTRNSGVHLNIQQDQYQPPYFIPPDLETWFKNNPQIQYNLQNRIKCVVNIDRRFVFGQQQAEEEY